MMEETIRVHHILCTTLFEGKGYSEGFCLGMEKIVSRLRKEPEQKLLPVCCPDAICSDCPYLTPENTCSSNYNQIAKRDEYLWKLFELQTGQSYSYLQLQKIAAEKLKESDFMKICGDCRWNKAGICTFKKLMRKLKSE